ncbi:MAG: extracellular solute-binding protein [Salinarimonas sp.]
MSTMRRSGRQEEGFGAAPPRPREGPGALPGGERQAFTPDEMRAFIDFLEEVEAEEERVLPLVTPDPYLRMTLFLMRNHLEGKLTTISSLAAGSGAPYATAMRRIADMSARGLVDERPRSASGKSVSLHPSPALIEAFSDYAHRMKLAIGKALGFGDKGGRVDYFFGGSYMKAQVVPLPAARTEPLGITAPLRLLVHADPTFMAMDSLKRQFEQLLGVSIRNRALSIDRLRLEMLANAERAASAYDIVAVDLPWIGEFAEKGVLAPLDACVAREGFDVGDFHAAGWLGCLYGGRAYGVPIQTTPELLFYRRDLLAEAGLEPPRTTDELLATARALHRPARNVRGIAWNGARGTPLGHTFMFAMADFGQPVIDLRRRGEGFDPLDLTGERLRPMIDGEGGRRAADFLMRLLDVSAPGVLSMSWFERVKAYASGEVAMAYGYSLLAPYFELDPASPAHGTTGYAPHPAGPGRQPIAPVGGYVLGIPANLSDERRRATEKAVRLLTSPEACKLYITNGSRVCPRHSVSADPDVRAISPVVGVVDDLARAGGLQLWPRPPAPDFAEITAILGEEIHDMLCRRKSPAAALANAQNRADALMRAAGRY